MAREPKSDVPLTAERLRALLRYDEASGEFRWRRSTSNAALPGSIAGTIDARGYRRIRIDRKTYAAHRLAWLYVHGEWPHGEIDHRDRNTSNNAIDNLRSSTHGQNIANSKTRSDNGAGIKGITYRRHIRKWQARICKDGKCIELGCWPTLDEARSAYLVAAEKLFGEFARAG